MNAIQLLTTKLYKRRAAKGRISGPVVKLAIGAIAVGLAVMLLAVCITEGFQKEIRYKVSGFGAHIVISKIEANASFELSPIEFSDSLSKQLSQLKHVKSIQPFVQKAGIVRSKSSLEGILFKGVGKDYDWHFFQQYLVKGKIPAFDTTSSRSGEILISSYLAQKLNLDIDSALVSYFIQDPPKARKLKVAGIYNTGLQEGGFDQLVVIGDSRLVRKLNNWNAQQVSGIDIYVNDFNKIDAATNALNDVIPLEWSAESVRERYPQLFNWIDLQDINVIIIIFLMVAVGLINMATALLILLLENTKIIGLLKALGAENKLISRFFMALSLRMLWRGLLFGNLIGLGLAALQYFTGIIRLDAASYYIDRVPVAFNLTQLLLLNIGVVGICLLTLSLPLQLIKKFSPAEILRYD